MKRSFRWIFALAIASALAWTTAAAPWAKEAKLEWIRVDPQKAQFVHEGSGKRFVAWGFNYDHDDAGRLLEDYWHAEWPTVEQDFREMKQFGANVVRIHLQFGKFMTSATEPNPKAHQRLTRRVSPAG